jgi:hypothetical protein
VDNDDYNEETLIEVMYNEKNMSNEDWLKIKQEIQYIDNLLNERGHLLEIMNDEESAAIVNVVEEIEKYGLDYVVDKVNTETKVNIDEVFEASTTKPGQKQTTMKKSTQNEKNKNCLDLNILMNGFEFVGFDIWEQKKSSIVLKCQS